MIRSKVLVLLPIQATENRLRIMFSSHIEKIESAIDPARKPISIVRS